ncbi:MAG: exopolyphosphatase / guanosine-5-triphosphate,3-diphosphate pyrophosphatase [Thermoleophilaceae bacterium]|jgi:exopolyphosphatase/guanosine-5'-triphosphate,3'-diphosphate pyrophosphatase|nr:exopolyphosphatase / guanosine-5-triphosphate,3-diphosphate pyrophosphatase [Thermoleophilaceae bacterium]
MRHMAVIDMGSNSFRLVVYGFEPGEHWQHVDEIREAVRISAGMGEKGALRPKPVERAERTAALFASFTHAAGIEEVEAVATSAIRIASNGEELLDRIHDETGLVARVLSEEEEAYYGYLAIANSTTLEDGFGIDIGGGSVQVMQIKNRKLKRSASWPLGAVRMSEQFLTSDKPDSKELKALRKHVAKEVRSVDWLGSSDGDRLAGIGGTIRNLAEAVAREAGLPRTDPQGYCLERDALEKLIDELADMPPAKRGSVPGIKPDRGDVILGGAVVLSTLMDEIGIDAIETTNAGLREGVFFERYLEHADPPLFEDVRRASVENLANRYQEDLTHPQHVADLSLQIYDGLKEHGLMNGANGNGSRQLLWAAGMLHDIGTAVDYDDHHKHSQYLIENAGLPGFSPREVGLIALIARYHRKGDPDISPLGDLARKSDERRLAILSGVIRLAEQLERSRDSAVGSVTLAAVNGHVELEPVTNAEASVAIWSAQQNSDLLSRAIDRKVEIASPD